MNTTNIYTLACPDTREIRYVGKSNDLRARLLDHIKGEGETHKARWVRSLRRCGKRPIIEVLEVVPENQWQAAEQHWIRVLSSWGFDLTNGDSGGLGRGRSTPELNAKISAALSGKPNTALFKPIHRYNLDGLYIDTFRSFSEAAREVGRPHANIVRAAKGLTAAYGFRWSYERLDRVEVPIRRPISKEARAKISASQKGRIVSAETRAKQRQARLGVPPANKGMRASSELLEQMRRVCPSKKMVRQLEMSGQLIAVHDSIKSASEKTGATRCGILKCSMGQQSHAAGFKWSVDNPTAVA